MPRKPAVPRVRESVDLESLKRYIDAAIRDSTGLPEKNPRITSRRQLGIACENLSARLKIKAIKIDTIERLFRRHAPAVGKAASAQTAWIIGQAFGRHGVTWSSGPVALGFCDGDEQLMGVFGHLLDETTVYDADQSGNVSPYFRLITDPVYKLFDWAPFSRYRAAIVEPEIYEEYEYADISRPTRQQNVDVDPEVAEAQKRLAAQRRVDLLEELRLSPNSYDLLDKAWVRWSYENGRRGVMPWTIAKWIESFMRVDELPPYDPAPTWLLFQNYVRNLRRLAPGIEKLLSKKFPR